jgi:hypothetical protein
MKLAASVLALMLKVSEVSGSIFGKRKYHQRLEFLLGKW